jgi:hypothetical protein
VRELDGHDDPDSGQAEVIIERNWRFVGVGFFDVDTAARALASAAMAREHRRRRPWIVRTWPPSRPGRRSLDGWSRWVKGRRGEEVRPQGAGFRGLLGTSFAVP